MSAVQVLKPLWEKEKLLVTSNFSFSHSVFYPLGELSSIFMKFEIVVCNLFQFGRVQNLLFGKRLNGRQTHLLFTTQSRLLMTLKKNTFENIVGNRENAGNQHFLHNVFYKFQKEFPFLSYKLYRRLQILSIWTSLKICQLIKSSIVLSLVPFSSFCDYSSIFAMFPILDLTLTYSSYLRSSRLSVILYGLSLQDLFVSSRKTGFASFTWLIFPR